jgi:predicted RNase H-like nuclease (RuvC/YqgF family)
LRIMANEDLVGYQKRMAELRRVVQELERRRSTLLGRAEAGKERLRVLTEEIRQRGYDPTRLAAIRDEKLAELRAGIEALERSVQEADQQLTKIEEGGA